MMATLNSFIPSLIYSSSLLLILFSCVPSSVCRSSSNSPVCNCIRYNERFLNLTSLRDLLVQQEDTIVSCLIERSKYPMNFKLYHDETWPGPGPSFFDYFIYLSESAQSTAGRYLSELENKFSSEVLPFPGPYVPRLNCPGVLYYAGANCVKKSRAILDAYKLLIPKIAGDGDDDDDGQYVATASTDLTCLQALSWRINLGKFVAETKFRNSTEAYSALIRARNETGIRDLLTGTKVEDQVIKRVESKARIFGQYVNSSSKQQEYRVDPLLVSGLYKDVVIPITKDVEVDYLLRRLSKSSHC